jgi:hypothetical protein
VATSALIFAVLASAIGALSVRQRLWRRLGIADPDTRQHVNAVIKSGRLSGDPGVDDAASRLARFQIRLSRAVFVPVGLIVHGSVGLLTSASNRVGIDWYPVLMLCYAAFIIAFRWHWTLRYKHVLNATRLATE